MSACHQVEVAFAALCSWLYQRAVLALVLNIVLVFMFLGGDGSG